MLNENAQTEDLKPIPCAQNLASFQTLYDKGLYLQAYKGATAAFGPIREWKNTDALVLAGRMAMNLEGDRLSRCLFFKAFRNDPEHPRARVYALSHIRERFGILRALKLYEKWGDMPEADPDSRQYYYCQRAGIATSLRDFDTAALWLEKAEAVMSSPWLILERARLLERQDRYEESLSLARVVFKTSEWYRPAVQHAAHLLQTLNRDEEALELLTEAMKHLESAAVASQLAGLLDENKRYSEMLLALDDYERLACLIEKPSVKWLRLRRGRALCLLGEYPKAAELLREVKTEYWDGVVSRIEAEARDSRRVELPVPFVRQHWMTCAPATIASLSRFWERPFEHLKIADEICYDGTPAWLQRKWSEENGWFVKEFTVTWDSALQLLDRGIPFSIVTEATTSSHRQGVIGYDKVFKTLIIRDPSRYYAAEFEADELLREQAPGGPEGLVMLPLDRSSMLDGIELPDVALYDLHHQVQVSLAEHRRPEAAEALARLRELDPEHIVTINAAWRLASYDGNGQAILACVNQWLAKHPKAGNLLLSKLSLLRDFARREDRLAMLGEICKGKDSESVFWREYAQELLVDARQIEEAHQCGLRALRYSQFEAASWKTLADITWERRDWEPALEYYRIAACLDEKHEGRSRSYFLASRFLRKTDEALAFIRRRFERHGAKSSDPAITLFDMLAVVDRDGDAFVVLDDALRLRPDDGDLLLFAAQSCLQYGRKDDAARHLAAAKSCTRPVDWLEKAARLNSSDGKPEEALKLWREVLELSPLHLPAIRAIAQLLAEKDGPAAAISFMSERCAEFPHNSRLHCTWVGWLWHDGAEAAEMGLRKMLANDEGDAWAWRELVTSLRDQGRYEEALKAAEQAIRVDPHAASSHGFYANVLEQLGRLDEARAAFREAIKLSADYEFAVWGLLRLSTSTAEKRDELVFIESELIRQVLFGDSVLCFHRVAKGVFPAEQLLSSLKKALDARPDLWHAWSAVITQLVFMQKLDDALELAKKAVAQFPLILPLCYDLAEVYRKRRQPDEAIQALEQALRVNPNYIAAIQLLSDIYEENKEDIEKAHSIISAAMRRIPLRASLHGCLAWLLWRQDKRDEAVAEIQRAISLDQDYDWAWTKLRQWGQALDIPELASKLARELTKKRAGEAKLWLKLAESLSADPNEPELYDALEKALSLTPRMEDAHCLKVRMLRFAERYDDALAACRPAVYGQKIPVSLRSLAAWVEAQRGDIHKAVARIRRVVEENPDSYVSWERMAEWCDKLDMDDDVLVAARKMADLAPYDSVPHAYLADLELRRGRDAVAIESLLRALDLNPSYEYAGRRLIDVYLSKDRVEDAAKVLANLKKRGLGGEFIKVSEVRVAVRENRIHDACGILSEIAVMPIESDWPLQAVLDSMPRQHRQIEKILIEAANSPNASPFIGNILAKIWIKRGWFWIFFKLKKLLAKGAPGHRAVFTYISELGNDWDKGTGFFDYLPLRIQFRLLMWGHGFWLREDAEGWGMVGYFLSTKKSHRAAIRWFANWEQRSDVEPWMLYNLMISLLNLGRLDQIFVLVRKILELPVRDHGTKDIRLMLAFHEACDGELDEARRLLEGLERQHFAAFWQNCYDCYQVVHDLREISEREANPEKKAAAVKERLRTWRASAPTHSSFYENCYRTIFKKTTSCILRKFSPGIRFRLWVWWKLCQPIIPQ